MYRMKGSQTQVKIEKINMFIDSAANHANEITLCHKKTQWNEDGYEVSIAIGFFSSIPSILFFLLSIIFVSECEQKRGKEREGKKKKRTIKSK